MFIYLKEKLQWYWWVIGVCIALGTAGFMTATYTANLSTHEDLEVVEKKVDKVDDQVNKEVRKLEKEVRKVEIITERVDKRQQRLERKIDWLIQHQLNPGAGQPVPRSE